MHSHPPPPSLSHGGRDIQISRSCVQVSELPFTSVATIYLWAVNKISSCVAPCVWAVLDFTVGGSAGEPVTLGNTCEHLISSEWAPLGSALWSIPCWYLALQPHALFTTHTHTHTHTHTQFHIIMVYCVLPKFICQSLNHCDCIWR
jgi:hypothetical protein